MKKILLLPAILSVGLTAYAQIRYHDIVPDSTINDWNVYVISLSGTAHQANSHFIDIWFHPTPEVVINTAISEPCEILFDASGNLIAKLDSNAVVGSGGKWNVAGYDPLSSGGQGNWQSNAADKYLGFRFKKSTTWWYGWLKMTVASGAASFTVKEWAFDSSGADIKAGQKTASTAVYTVNNSSGLKLYPNPAQDRISVTGITTKDLKISDITGKSYAVPCAVNAQTLTADISMLPAGTYLLQAGTASTYFIKSE